MPSADRPGYTAPGSRDRDFEVGARVVVRRRLPDGEPAAYTDVVGVLTGADDAVLTVETRRGPVAVPRQDVVAAKPIPPRPTRPGRPHRTTSLADLERLMAQGWPALEQARLGDWLLRAAGGFTRRANSVLALGEPGLPLAQAVERCEAWYRERGLPPLLQLPLPDFTDVASLPLGARLLGLGYRAQQRSLVLTAAVAEVPAPSARAQVVAVRAEPAADWLAAYGRQRQVVPGVTERVLTGSRQQVFASIHDDRGQVTALARMSVSPGWAGLHALWVDPARRREGLAQALISALALRARARALPSVYVQVEQSNLAALRLFAGLGFTTHHAYCYLTPASAR